jgi:outer membrane protein assembly factor BamD
MTTISSRTSIPRNSSHGARRLALALVLMLPLLGGCGSSHDDQSDNTPVQVAPVETLYNNGIDALNDRRFATAADQFNAVQQNYPFSPWAVNAQLMAAYTQYQQNHYTDAITALDQFIQLHPAGRDIAYAYYLRALCYYEQIVDISRDQKGTRDAMTALQEVVTRFPDSAYARDAKLKIDLCRDHLAGKEMDIGRWYQGQHMYTAAIGRFQRVVDDYQTTNHVPEALARLVEIYLQLGLKDEAKRTAAVMGYNYPGSVWYADTYDQLVHDGLAQGAPVPSDVGGSASGFLSRTWHWLF